MKIVHIAGYFEPKLGYIDWYLPRKQVQLGHDVYVVTSNRNPHANILRQTGTENIIFKRRFSIVDGIKVYRLPCIFESQRANFVLVRGVKRILSEIRPDIVQTYEPVQGIAIMPALYKNKLKYKLVVLQQKYGFFSSLSKWEYLLFRRHLCNFVYSKSDAIITVTKKTKEFLMEIHKIDEARITESTLGVDLETFYFDELARKEIRHNLGIKSNDVVIITTGKIERYKRLELLIESFRWISKDYQDVKLLIVGSGDSKYLEELKQLTKECKIQQKVRFIDFVPKEELHRYYSAADIGVWPEQPSITIIEAMVCKLALVLPDADTTNHLMAFDNGLTFPRGDIKALRKCLEKLVSDEGLREVMSENSYNAVKQNFSYDVIAEKILTIYKEG